MTHFKSDGEIRRVSMNNPVACYNEIKVRGNIIRKSMDLLIKVREVMKSEGTTNNPLYREISDFIIDVNR